MIETHDLFLRALAITTPKQETDKKKVEKKSRYAVDEPKWPEEVLAFDTESRITVDQSLTFGVWRRCKLVAGEYELSQEGIFYADNLPAKDLETLTKYMETAVSDVAGFPPRFPMYSRSQ